MLLREITEMVYGTEHCDTVLSALELIRDARSGDTWTSYWWTEDGYVLGGNDPEDIEKRAEQSLAEIKKAALDRETRHDRSARRSRIGFLSSCSRISIRYVSMRIFAARCGA